MTTSTTDVALQRFEAESRRHYPRNFVAGLIHGIFLQMSVAFGSPHTVLPAFVTLLTPSTVAIGLMAAIEGVGEVVPQLFTAYLLEDKPRKKPYLLAVIITRWLSWIILAGLTYRYGLARPTLVLFILIGLFSLFSLAGGMGAVVYADIFARAIPARRRGRFVGTRQIIGFALAILAGWIIKLILDHETAYPFPTNYSLIFALSAFSLGVAITGFVLIREPIYPVKRENESLPAMLRRAVGLVRINANFRRFLAAQAVIGLGVGLSPFFVVHARHTLNLSAGAVGLFLSAQMAGAALSNLLWGWLADRYGNRTVIIGTIISGSLAPLLALLLPAVAPAAYALVFVAVGAMFSGRRIGPNNFILEMASPQLRTTCVALQNTLIAPVMLLPLAGGFLLEMFPFAALFGVEAILMSLGLLISWRLLDPRHGPAGACIS